jgi:hypothetical protein
MVLLGILGLQLLFLASEFRLLVPADTLLVRSLVRGVDFGAGFKRVHDPILYDPFQEISLAHLPLGSPDKVVYLALDAVAVLAKDTSYLARLVVVVKAGHHFCEVDVAQPASAVLFGGNLGSQRFDVFVLNSHRIMRCLASCLRSAVSPTLVKPRIKQRKFSRKQAGTMNRSARIMYSISRGLIGGGYEYYARMDFESKKDRINSNPYSRSSGNKVPQEKKQVVVDMTMAGKPVTQIQSETGLSKPTINAIQRNESDKFDLGQWKKRTTDVMSQIVARGSERLLTEIDNIPAGQLPLTIAILTDKIMALQDAPTVVVEHRLRVSHDDINAMVKGDVIDLPPDNA